MSVPNAVLILYFFASAKVLSVPANTSIALSRSNEPGGNALASSSGNAWVLNQMPLSAISLAVASSIRWPCSMHFTPAAIARWIETGVYACTVT